MSIENILNENLGLYNHFCKLLEDEELDKKLKKAIEVSNLGHNPPILTNKSEEEAIRYFLWFDGERSSLFFAKHIIICEGASEKIYIDYLLNEHWSDLKNNHIYLLDALGKFNIHRYLNLFGSLGINHSVLMDRDENKLVQKQLNEFIEQSRNSHTREIYSFDKDLETFLEIELSNRAEKKPLNIIWNHNEGKIKPEKIDALRNIIEKLID